MKTMGPVWSALTSPLVSQLHLILSDYIFVKSDAWKQIVRRWQFVCRPPTSNWRGRNWEVGVEWREGGSLRGSSYSWPGGGGATSWRKKGLEIRRKELHHDQEVLLLLCGTKNANSGAQIKDHVYTPNCPPHTHFNINIIFVCSCPDLRVVLGIFFFKITEQFKSRLLNINSFGLSAVVPR